MNILVYDNTFEGLLTAIYDALDLNIVPDKIVSKKTYQSDMFAIKYEIDPDLEKFESLWEKIRQKTNEQNCQRIFKAFLSETENIENVIYNYIKLILSSSFNIETNFGNDSVLKLNNAQKKVAREAQRVLMFVRFQKTSDNIYYASFDPKYNVIPLTVNHFKNRFTNQQWVIFDTRRKYGFYYDKENVREVTIGNKNINLQTGKVNANALHVSEKLFQKLWQGYYDSINISERKNLKVHTQFLPKRFWKFLPEKDLSLK
ncbi:MAG: TIGR03915 family putative DNA repair protein [Bacteroidales bacterium]|nr:TIGR03915 family putative DNA repair protein [Bacteroidales bacterium]